ncbi:NUDIX hydrolase [Virgibacillus ihumii]|uniref:NUDIX hydrolase n=1 Tax=Virgibacillus ihumii TaxID=2686091 RepID=UPI00157CF2FE|nr:NUDIX domain-containing protein [Virgibacillus ihumii]
MVNNRGVAGLFLAEAVERGGAFEQAVIRKVKEEAGLTIEVEHIVSVNEAFFKERDHYALFTTFKAKIINGSPAALLLVNFNQIRKQKFTMRSLYPVDGKNAYKYTKGFNILAIIAFALGIYRICPHL